MATGIDQQILENSQASSSGMSQMQSVIPTWTN